MLFFVEGTMNDDCNNEIDLSKIPYGVTFEHEGRRYIGTSFANTRLLCYDITDLPQVQISLYTKVHVDDLIKHSLDNYAKHHEDRHLAHFQQDEDKQ